MTSGAFVAQSFDAAAARYDADFSGRLLGRWLRAGVRERLAELFPAGSRVLELGCGTGDDAVWLAERGVHVTAVDSSPAMLAAAAARVEQAQVADRVSLEQLELEELGRLAQPSGRRFDGAVSNFGPLNCVRDRRPIAESLARCVRPGGRVALVVMGPVCAWEIAWHLARGRPRTAFRRFRSGAPAHVGGGATVRVWYPSPRRLRAELEPWFAHRETVAVGVVLPPPYLSSLVERRPDLFARLRRLERRIAERFPSPWLADHYLAVFERRA